MINENKEVRLNKGTDVVQAFCPYCGPSEPNASEDFGKHVVFRVVPDRSKALTCPKCEKRFQVIVR